MLIVENNHTSLLLGIEVNCPNKLTESDINKACEFFINFVSTSYNFDPFFEIHEDDSCNEIVDGLTSKLVEFISKVTMANDHDKIRRLGLKQLIYVGEFLCEVTLEELEENVSMDDGTVRYADILKMSNIYLSTSDIEYIEFGLSLTEVRNAISNRT